MTLASSILVSQPSQDQISETTPIISSETEVPSNYLELVNNVKAKFVNSRKKKKIATKWLFNVKAIYIKAFHA